jgi:hypothetical protein
MCRLSFFALQKNHFDFDRKNTVLGKCIVKAATSCNERFGTMAGVPRWIVLRNSKLSGSWQEQEARHCAKPPLR